MAQRVEGGPGHSSAACGGFQYPSYDPAGTVSYTARFYNSILNRGSLALDFGLGMAKVEVDPLLVNIARAACEGARRAPRLEAVVGPATKEASLSIAGVGGDLRTFEVDVSDDGRTVSVVFANRALANRKYYCARAGNLIAYRYTDITCNFGGCPIDSVGVDKLNRAKWFPGFRNHK